MVGLGGQVWACLSCQLLIRSRQPLSSLLQLAAPVLITLALLATKQVSAVNNGHHSTFYFHTHLGFVCKNTNNEIPRRFPRASFQVVSSGRGRGRLLASSPCSSPPSAISTTSAVSWSSSSRSPATRDPRQQTKSFLLISDKTGG